MAKIVCGVGECAHNKMGDCCANIVSVVGASSQKDCDTCCSSFLKQTIYSELTSSATGDRTCTCLECKVKTCKHNVECCCRLDHIKVNGDNVDCYDDTNCLSFELKN